MFKLYVTEYCRRNTKTVSNELQSNQIASDNPQLPDGVSPTDNNAKYFHQVEAPQYVEPAYAEAKFDHDDTADLENENVYERCH